jgi:glycyl-tRNA synthetase beta chain
MPQLLLEILSEEIPARMQAKAQADLERALMDRLSAAGLMPEGIKGFSGPRRLTAVVEGLPVKSADVVEDVIGPKEGAPDAAIQGFLKKAGLASISQAHVHEVPKKGRVYVAHVRKAGRETASLIAEMVPAIIREFHWPKSMRWGNGDLRWVRPISRILCTFDGEVVPFEIEGIASGDLTEGHRVLGRGPFKVRRFEDYEDVLKNKGQIVLDREERKEIILADAKALCQAQNLELVEDIGLLEEVAGLAEHPVVLVGDMDPAFLDLPPEVIKLSMRTHQKYFAVRDPAKADGALAPKFVVVANLTPTDGGEKIAAGNSRVLSARLNDARFFWDNDRKVSLESRFDKLGDIVFHEKLGTVKDKAERVMALGVELTRTIPADPKDVRRAALLAKCDLVSDMVGEFAELEGVMGRYYATSANLPEKADVADAIRDHYRPKGPSDEVPSNPVSIAVALADKLDTLIGFWAIGEKPTGSKDPFALRRAALGVIRTALTTQHHFRLSPPILVGLAHLIRTLPEEGADQFIRINETGDVVSTGDEIIGLLRKSKNLRVLASPIEKWCEALAGRDSYDFDDSDEVIVEMREFFSQLQALKFALSSGAAAVGVIESTISNHLYSQKEAIQKYSEWVPLAAVLYAPALLEDLRAFFADRLKVHLREQGARHDLIDAVFALGEDDLVLIVKRVEALGAFLGTDDGKNLLAGSKRGANILRAEEKKDGEGAFAGAVDPKLFDTAEEKALHDALAKAGPAADAALKQEDFARAMRVLAQLRGPVDAFFEKVIVNADKPDVRINRLRLLSQMRDAMGRVADFSKVEG